eukprot:c14791_g1_i1 orf=290-1795(-)
MGVIEEQRCFLLIGSAFIYFILISSFMTASVQAGRIGFCYGRDADNLPTPSQVAQFLINQSIDLVRIYDNDLTVIQAFANTNIEVFISVPNSDLQSFQTEKQADEWVNTYLAPLYPATNITAITVGAEVITLDPGRTPLVLPAMKNIHTGLTKAGLSDKIRVTTTHSMGILMTSFPPSAAAFNDTYTKDFVKPLLAFLESTGSSFMINAYPYLAYSKEPQRVSLDYAFFQSKQMVVDPTTNLEYASMFDAQIDAVYYAMEAMGYSDLNVLISETGWPTQGGTSEQGADVENAATYNNNLVTHILSSTGTPHRPGQPIDAFVFSLFDEDRKPGSESERHWGVYNPDGSRKYYLNLQGTGNGLSQSFNRTGETWCIALPGASNDSLAAGIDWACGKGNADCRSIQQGQPCYLPDTYENHASVAYNSYYQRSGDNAAACNFSGTATIINTNPSYGSCIFSSDSSALSPTPAVRGNATSAAYCHNVHDSNKLKLIAICSVLIFAL